MITAPLPWASPPGSGRLSMIIPQNHGLTITYNYVTGSEKRYIVAHIFKIELLAPRGRVSSQL